MDAMNRVSRLLSSLTATRTKAPVAVPIFDRDLFVAAQVERCVERCGSLTEMESASLHDAWQVVENDPEILARIREGARLAHEARPDAVREVSDAAERAYVQTLHVSAREIRQLAHDPIHGPTIAAIRAHATAVAACFVIPVPLADAMSGPWHEAVGPGVMPTDPKDALTGLHVHAAVRPEIARRRRAGESFSLLLIDIDDFKAVNGWALHERGDRMLRRTGQAIVAVSPAGATVFRNGGDEFAVLVATAAVREAVELGERICAAVAVIEVPESNEPDDFPGPWHLACSIGVARYPADGQTANDLLRAADTSMYEAKRAGGGRVATARPA
jgi:diguanylate cyclase (GGDEF)-like protein